MSRNSEVQPVGGGAGDYHPCRLRHQRRALDARTYRITDGDFPGQRSREAPGPTICIFFNPLGTGVSRSTIFKFHVPEVNLSSSRRRDKILFCTHVIVL